MQTLTILHTESSCGWGGQEIRILTEARGMIERGHQVGLFCPAHAPIFEKARELEIDVFTGPIEKKNIDALKTAFKWMKRYRVDIVNTHSSTDSWLFSLCKTALRKNCKMVRTRHISAPVSRGLTTRWLYTSGTDHIITTGTKLRDTLIKHNRFNPNKITSIPTGIDLTHFNRDNQLRARKTTNLPIDIYLVGIVATIRSWKGHCYLLEAIARQPDDVHLVIVGDGPYLPTVREKLAELRIEHRVHLVGHKDDVLPWLQSMDLFVLPSTANEGVPQSLMQAMACEIPVISTPVGSIPEIISDEQTGLLVPPENSDALADAILRVFNDSMLYRRLAGQGYELAQERFGLDVMLDETEAVYQQLLGL